ncbi:unnamed protein product, partial [Linum tenue]
ILLSFSFSHNIKPVSSPSQNLIRRCSPDLGQSLSLFLSLSLNAPPAIRLKKKRPRREKRSEAKRKMELSLDLGLVHISKTVAECLKEVAKVKDVGQKLSKLDDYVNRLEDERRKIEVFRRELPLCMLLLNDAILKLKEEALRYKELNGRAGAGQGDGIGEEEGKVMNKKSWMDSVQLWKTGDSNQMDSISEPKQRSEEEDDRSTCENPIQQLPTRGGAFMAFKPTVGCGRKEEKEVVSQATELSLMTPSPPELVLAPTRGSIQQMKVQSTKPQPQASQLQPNKKQRRCWEPELHKHFMNVLDELGGPHVATPKQIRERMQVEGLTNDEVKSHLQKYRLHIRKHTTPSAGPANGLWTPKYEGNNRDDTPKPKVLQSNMESESMGGFSRSSNEGESMEGGDEKSECHDSSKGGTEKVNNEGREIDVWR